jgi:hypothetical protein
MSEPRTCKVMLFWHDFLDSLDTDGGRIFLLLALLAGGSVMSRFGVAKADDIIVGSFGALLLALKVSGSNKDRREGPPMPLPTNAGAAPVAIIPAPTAETSVAPIVAAVDSVAAAIKDEKK